jgi:hypothetical protein
MLNETESKRPAFFADVSLLCCYAVKMETVYFTETLVSTNKSTRRCKPEDQHQHLHRRENLINHLILLLFVFSLVFDEVKLLYFP